MFALHTEVKRTRKREAQLAIFCHFIFLFPANRVKREESNLSHVSHRQIHFKCKIWVLQLLLQHKTLACNILFARLTSLLDPGRSHPKFVATFEIWTCGEKSFYATNPICHNIKVCDSMHATCVTNADNNEGTHL
jgi:hypothetical protein